MSKIILGVIIILSNLGFTFLMLGTSVNTNPESDISLKNKSPYTFKISKNEFKRFISDIKRIERIVANDSLNEEKIIIELK